MEQGQTIAGKYRLNRALGAGGMASVWSATNVFTERDFAIKFLLPHVASAPEAARRFLLEAKVSARINHPNIIEVIDVGQADDGALFLVMELLDGMSLESAMRRVKPPMGTHEFLRVMLDVARALEAAHQKGVVHRDLKPSNVFLHKDRNGQATPKVLDFGVSKFLEENADGGMTVVGTILGSPLYMSPEQALGAEGIDGRTDIFAFGSILFEALCGQRAYAASNLNALIVAIATTQPRRLDDVAPELPQLARDLVRDCMVTDKTRRLASFGLVIERLRPLIALMADTDAHLPAPRLSENGGEERSKRISDRPSALSGSGASVPPLSMPAPTADVEKTTSNGTPAPRWTPARSLRSLRSLRDGPRSVARTWAAAGAAVVLVVLVGIGSSLIRSGHAQRSSAEAAPPPARDLPPAATSPAATPPEDSNGVPVVSVDSLPVVARGSAQAKTGGRLSVAATPGWCSITVDGAPRGATPLPSFQIGAGTHRLECIPPAGSAKTASVTVTEGTEAHYQFTLAQ